MEFPVTADQVRQTVTDYGITHLPHHDCGGCGVWVKFVFSPDGERIAFDPNCDCGSPWSPPRETTFQELADWFNMQSVPGVAQTIWDRMMELATKTPSHLDAAIAVADKPAGALEVAATAIEVLAAALKPFAEVGKSLLPQSPADDSPWVTSPDDTPYGNQGLTFGDLRAAARALDPTVPS